jgi:hypothetical protein
MGSDHGLRAFWRAMVANWFTAMSGPLSVPAAIIALFVTSEAAKIVFGFMAFACVWASAYWLWRREREVREIAERKLSDIAADDAEHYASLRVADCPEIVNLFKGNDPKLMGLLMSQKLRSWAKLMSSSRTILHPLGPDIWQSHTFNFQPNSPYNDPPGINQTALRLNGTVQASHYDICLNVAQVKRFWPELLYLEAHEMRH